MDDETTFLWGAVVRSYYHGFVLDSYPFKISDFIELQLKVSQKEVYPVAQIVHAFQDTQKGNFVTVRKTYRASEVKALSEDVLKETHEEKIFISKKLYDIPVENIRAKCEVKHQSEISDLKDYVSFERQYFYDSWYDADSNTVSKIEQPLDLSIQVQYPRSTLLQEIPPIKVIPPPQDPLTKEQNSRNSTLKQRPIVPRSDSEENSPEVPRKQNEIPRAIKRRWNTVEYAERNSSSYSRKDSIKNSEKNSEKESRSTIDSEPKRKRGRPPKVKDPDSQPSSTKGSPVVPREDKKASNLARRILHSTNANEKPSSSETLDVSSLINNSTKKVVSPRQEHGPSSAEIDGETYRVHDCIFLIAKDGEKQCIARIESYRLLEGETFFNARLFLKDLDPTSRVHNLFKPRDDKEIALTDIWGFDFRADSKRVLGKCVVEHISTIIDLKDYISKKNHFYYEYELKFGSGILVRIAKDPKSPAQSTTPIMTSPKSTMSSPLSSPFFMGTAGKPIAPKSQLQNLPNFPGTIRTHPDLLQYLLRQGISGRLLVLCLINSPTSYYAEKYVETLVSEHPQVIFVIVDPQITGSLLFKDISEYPTFRFYKNVSMVGDVAGLQKEKIKELVKKFQ